MTRFLIAIALVLASISGGSASIAADQVAFEQSHHSSTNWSADDGAIDAVLEPDCGRSSLDGPDPTSDDSGPLSQRRYGCASPLGLQDSPFRPASQAPTNRPRNYLFDPRGPPSA